MKQWYVLKYLFNKEKRAEAHLINQGWNVTFRFSPVSLLPGEALNRLNPSYFFLANLTCKRV